VFSENESSSSRVSGIEDDWDDEDREDDFDFDDADIGSGDITKMYNRSRSGMSGPNSQKKESKVGTYAPREQSFKALDKHVNTNKLKKAGKTSVKHTGRDDRATNEQVLDPRTRLILYKMLNKGLIDEINGCISTGKEANVYHAVTPTNEEFAIKVYKTAVLSFKDRDRYVSGEFRFRNGYCKSNPRKMVKLWAEKEMRNLKRLNAAGIPSPEPVMLRLHVLLMKFIGKDGCAAPRLKDATLSDSRFRDVYMQCVKHMRTLYQKCKLVHADLSEYNMLYYKHKLYFIDVSQSVEFDHPSAQQFLRMDCTNVTDYFVRACKDKMTPMTPRELYEFIVDDTINEEEEGAIDKYLEEAQRRVGDREARVGKAAQLAEEAFAAVDKAREKKSAGMTCEEGGEEEAEAAAAAEAEAVAAAAAVLAEVELAELAEKEVDDQVFMSSRVPRSLMEVDVDDFQRRLKATGPDSVSAKFFKSMTTPGAKDQRRIDEAADSAAGEGGAEDQDLEEGEEGEEGGEEGDARRAFIEVELADLDGKSLDELKGISAKGLSTEEQATLRAALKQSQKEHKKATKESRQEQLKNKMPKHIKKKKIKKHQAKAAKGK
jgi:RIO kinase 1